MSMLRHLTSFFAFLFLLPAFIAAQVTLQDYLPDDVTYNPDIPVPSSVLGFEVGEWHVRHGLVVEYLYKLAEASDRITIQEYARTYERRPLLLLTISTPENLSRIDEIHENHLALNDPSRSQNLNINDMPVVTWLGYSVHGNEPSGGNAALITAYYLAAAQGEKIDELLQNSVVLLDPVYNPDGFDRFANWVNMHKSFAMNNDRFHREHTEVWPFSRTNHYWFDLNRDWMPVVHPESRGRIAMYQHWKPNVLTDHHEMGTNSTYFFQPGVPSRDNPLTPARTFELTGKLAEFHADYLNEFGVLYWTEEVFDDFYLGKGSTYPDLQGTIGILFEQASSRGHLQESQHGDLDFPTTIRNQFVTSLSTLYGSLALRTELLSHMRDFYTTAISEARSSNINAYVFGSEKDQARNYHLLDILRAHSIDVYELARELTVDGKTFKPGTSWIVPTEQPQYRFLTGLFETRTEFTDSLFYDVSTWTLPYAFNLPYAEVRGRAFRANLLGDAVNEPQFPTGNVYAEADDYAFLFEWYEYYAPRALYRLMDANVRVQVAERSFRAQTREGLRDFSKGTIMVSSGTQDVASKDEIFGILQTIADEDGIDVFGLSTGLTPRGPDLGSRNFAVLRNPNVMILGGQGVSMNEAGEIWHLFDQRYHIPVSIVEKRVFEFADLSRYNTIVMVQGNYNDLSENAVNRLRDWVRSGGTLITQRSATQWAARNGFSNAKFKSRPDNEFGNQPLPYISASGTRGAQVIGGSIFFANLDRTHPLGFGFENDRITVFRNNTLMLESPQNPWASPLRYTSNPLASGYISARNLEIIGDVPSIQVSSLGSGRVILMTDNANFRGFWYGTNKLFTNAVFFGNLISGVTTE